MRRLGVLMNRVAEDPDGRARLAALQQGLAQLGWSDGRNVRIDTRWGEDKFDLEQKYAAELVALAPDVILASGGTSVAALQRLTRTVPIVFAAVVDPIGTGLTGSLSRPDGNATGFMNYEYSLGAKWLELLRQIAPNLARVTVFRDPDIPSGIGLLGTIQNAAQALRIEVRPAVARDAGDIERAIETLARAQNGGLIVTASGPVSIHRDVIIALVARHKLPAVYPWRSMVADGGLMSYAPDLLDDFRRAAGYVDRILKGDKLADLPVQAPTKYELVINLKTAKAIGLAIPPSLLATANEVIE
jgi:putative tryptophan/tyrosine transport system substrate-binding protein